MIAPVQKKPRFRVGQLVRHRRYGYRGVVVAFDSFCQAPDEWYYANQTQPHRDQSWYHVLVDQRQTVTYAAESSLLPDHSNQPVDHPWVDDFFSGFDGQSYVRNERTFPGV